jgi:hypothetical protein
MIESTKDSGHCPALGPWQGYARRGMRRRNRTEESGLINNPDMP